MRYRLALGRALALAAVVPASGVAAQSPIDTAQARRYFEEARALSDADGARLWGVPLYGPLLFADRATRTVVANVPDPDGALERAGGVFIATLPDGVGIANTAVEWAGRRWTMVVWPLPVGRYERARLLAHELFHRIQPDVGLTMANPQNAHLERFDGRLWLRLEWRALAAALAADGEDRRAAVRDALVFRAHRRALDAGAAAEENALELNEGLSEYTGFAASGLPRARLLGWALVWLEQSDARAGGSAIGRSFAYASGPAWGLLLDEAGGDWRGRIAAVGDPGVLLAEAYRVELPADVAAAAAARLPAYDGERLRAAERAREDRRVATLARLRARFVEGPTLRLPVADGFGYSFDPNDAETFEDRGTVYGAAEVRAAWGVLEVTGGVLLERGPGGITGVVVPAPADGAARPLTGDGWTLRLADGWTLGPGERAGDWILTRG